MAGIDDSRFASQWHDFLQIIDTSLQDSEGITYAMHGTGTHGSQWLVEVPRCLECKVHLTMDPALDSDKLEHEFQCCFQVNGSRGRKRVVLIEEQHEILVQVCPHVPP